MRRGLLLMVSFFESFLTLSLGGELSRLVELASTVDTWVWTVKGARSRLVLFWTLCDGWVLCQ